MDFIAHGLWSYIFFNRNKKWKYAIFFGLFPDLISWTIYLIYLLARGEVLGRPNPALIPSWVQQLYQISHSLFVVMLVFALAYLLYKKVPIYSWAWPIHIGLDIFSHSRTFLPTPFLWPISSWTFPGVSWGTPMFMIINYICIASAFSFILYRKQKHQHL